MLLATCLRHPAILRFAFSIFGKLTLLLLIVFGSAQAQAVSCSYKNFSIGLEISANAEPDASGQYYYVGTSIRCDPNGVVIYDSGTGFPDPYDFGWIHPNNLVTYIRNTFGPSYAAGRYFLNGCKSHLLVVSQYYPSGQSVAGVGMAGFPPSNTAVYAFEVFDPLQYLHVPVTVGMPNWDYMGQSSNCQAPPEYTTGADCSTDMCNGTNPINTGWYGVKNQTERDFIGEGSYPLHFARHYVSRVPAVPGMAPRLDTPIAAWGYTYANRIVTKLIQSSNGDSNPKLFAYVIRPDNRIFTYKQSGANWISDIAEVTHQLKQSPDGSWQFITNQDETESYDASGKLLSIKNRAGLMHSLTYTPTGITVTDSFGRTLNIGLTLAGALQSLTTPKGEVYNYSVSGQMITSVTYLDNTIRTYEYLGGRLLSGIVDEKGVRIAAWSYDNDNRAKSSEHGGGTNKYSISYSGSLNLKAAPVTITDPKGTARTYTYSGGSVVKQTSSSLPCDTCGKGDIASATYDPNGFIAAKADFNGNSTTYTHDARGLEASRTEAVGTPQARTITTQYHPTFHLPIQINEPGRVTDFVYDNLKGTLLSKTITDTATNKKRVWAYTYNIYGQLLTVDAPRTDVADTATYTYDAQGNVASMTNALGHITQYTSYDANGRLLSMSDPNGLVTTMSYDKRGRMLTRQVGLELTQFTYDEAGKLIRTTAPDATAISYIYD